MIAINPPKNQRVIVSRGLAQRGLNPCVIVKDAPIFPSKEESVMSMVQKTGYAPILVVQTIFTQGANVEGMIWVCHKLPKF